MALTHFLTPVHTMQLLEPPGSWPEIADQIPHLTVAGRTLEIFPTWYCIELGAFCGDRPIAPAMARAFAVNSRGRARFAEIKNIVRDYLGAPWLTRNEFCQLLGVDMRTLYHWQTARLVTLPPNPNHGPTRVPTDQLSSVLKWVVPKTLI